jgi:hypothetical protein
MVSFTNPGGHPGPDGQPGASGRARLEDGKNGPDGSVHVFIQNTDGQLMGPFPSAYKLEILDFEIVNVIEEGVLEFGEQVTLRKIRIKNAGFSSWVG